VLFVMMLGVAPLPPIAARPLWSTGVFGWEEKQELLVPAIFTSRGGVSLFGGRPVGHPR
jgi:hypothetical protein